MSSPGMIFKIALSLINTVGPITAKSMVSHCGSAEAVFRANKKVLLKIPGIGPKTIREIQDKRVMERACQELEIIAKNNLSVLYYLDDNYPKRLKNLDDAPVILYLQGTNVLNYNRTIGIVGTRKPTERSKLLCQKLITSLKEYNPLIISGLAYGIDVVAHRAALENNLPTLGIMGNGLSVTYPAVHRGLRRKMAIEGGILSEFTYKTGPEREHFPMRNRIIAGMSDAIIVIESARKGGSMITAQFAFAYNKDVFAVPGRPGDPLAAGPNHLIKSNVASLIENGDDLAFRMMWERSQLTDRSKQLKLFNELSEREQRIIEIIRNSEIKTPSLDFLIYESKMNMNELSGLLLELELKSIIKNLPGSKYMVIA